MPKGKIPKTKRELAIKKAKRKKTILLVIVVVIAVALLSAIVISVVKNANTELYTDGGASIRLHPDGKFTAVLYHNERYKGTYEKAEDGSSVAFTTGAGTVFSRIDGDVLMIPNEWDDSHSHSLGLPRK